MSFNEIMGDDTRRHIKDLIKEYQKETGKEPIDRGRITTQFLEWRDKKEKNYKD